MPNDPWDQEDYNWGDSPNPTWKKWVIFAAFAIASVGVYFVLS